MKFAIHPGLLLLLLSFSLFAQKKIDGIVAVIGPEIILQSELDAYTMLRLEGLGIKKDSLDHSQYQTQFLNELIDGKILIAHAKKDSTISVSNQEVEQMLNNHISNLLRQNNLSIEGLDAALQKEQGITLAKFKSEARRAIKEQLYKQKVQQSYLSSIKVSRKDVEEFFNEYKDSLPSVGESVLLSKLSMELTTPDSVRQRAYDKIKSIKTRLDNGGDFSELAKKFSESPEGADGGELGFIAKGTLSELAFEEKAFNLPVGQISEPFETRLGFHIINVTAKRDSKVNVRQIFIKIAPPEQILQSIITRLDSIRTNCKSKQDFEAAVTKFSSDNPSKIHKGSLGWISLVQLPADLRIAVDTLQPGAITAPLNDKNVYSIYRVDERTNERKLTIENDYNILAEKTKDILAQKKLIDLVSQWRNELYIDIRI
ncbi:MAG: hypothetical protein GX640_17775 [Fibrobacter sp.]|nr:hypothetical protein [Fibrobacter sp.]